jgi:hypothetical protein
MLMNPIREEALLKLWRLRTNNELKPTTAGGLVLSHNFELKSPPENADDGFPLGWQPMPRSPHFTAAVLPSDDRSTTSPLAIRVQYDSFAGMDSQERSWDFHRLLVPAGEPLALDFAVRLDPPEVSRVWIKATWKGGETRSDVADMLDSDWQPLMVRIPATDEARVVTVTLQRQSRSSAGFATGRAWLATDVGYFLRNRRHTISDSAGKNFSTTPR